MQQKEITAGGYTYNCVKDFGYDHRIGVRRSDASSPRWFRNVEEVEYYFPNLKGLMNW